MRLLRSRGSGRGGASGFGCAVQMLLGGIEHHVEEEETELLPELKSSLGRADWLAMGDALAETTAAAGQTAKPTQSRRKCNKRSKAA